CGRVDCSKYDWWKEALHALHLQEETRGLASDRGMSKRAGDRAQGFPRWTISDWRKKKEDIFAFVGSEKTLSRAPGRPESVPYGIERITYMKDTR
ncbi:hypothetical protein JG688_00013476, partial [Phytophthora aleatoria]